MSLLMLAGSLMLAGGCTKESSKDTQAEAAAPEALSQQARPAAPVDSLPEVEPQRVTSRFLQKLQGSTALGENAVVHVKLPPPLNPLLKDSLVRIVGEPDAPQVLIRSDALEALGLIKEGQGNNTFGLLTQFDSREVDRRKEGEELLRSGRFGETTDKAIIFRDRTPVAVSQGVAFDKAKFEGGEPVGLDLCPFHPVSTEEAWGQSLLITAAEVVQDDKRTWDPCTGKGNKGGVWTFANLMREMAAASGQSAEDFVLEWLSLWLNDYTVNGDKVEARVEMFHKVIKPWASASGWNASLEQDGERFYVSLDGPLDLDIAPFRLLAIVNRLDLGGAGDGKEGKGGYGGGTTSAPTDAGELRFVFGVVQPDPWGGGTEETCGLMPFTVIFEYGVPIQGCGNVAQWARQWTQLNTYGGFTAEYLEHLQALTQLVVKSGAAPDKGNKSAINQIRTNENALGDWGGKEEEGWEMREFTLTDEDPVKETDTPSNGLLRPHTVAQTPDDVAYPASGSSPTDDFVMGPVFSGLGPVGVLPDSCGSAYTVPYFFQDKPFRGGHSHMSPYAWESWVIDQTQPDQVCSRHQFSLNTCNGCHARETDTWFTHVDPLSGIPAQLSGFLTGGGPGSFHEVPDFQYGDPKWRFADLERRFQRLFEVAWCTECAKVTELDEELLKRLEELLGFVPFDPVGPVKDGPFKVGAVTDLDQVRSILEVRGVHVTGFRDEPVDVIRRAQSFVH